MATTRAKPAARVPVFKKGTLVHDEAAETFTGLFLVSVTSKGGYDPGDALQSVLENARYNSYDEGLAGYTIHKAVEA